MTSNVQPPVLDEELAMTRVGGDRELLKELAQLFAVEYPQMIAELRAAHERGDSQQVERAAHGLKGSIANFGAQQGVVAAQEIEQLGHKGNLAPVGSLLHTLDLILLALHGELDQL